MKQEILHAVGENILIRALEIESVKIGSLYIEDGRSATRKEELQCKGEVVSVGADAYADKRSPWCKVGDIVYFIENGARMVKRITPDANEVSPKHRLIRDIDVCGVIEEIENNE